MTATQTKTVHLPPAKYPPRFGQLQTTFAVLGYRWFDQGDYNLNLIGVRSNIAFPDWFNDWFCVAFRTHGRPHLFAFPATTDPGLYWREHPANVAGTAIVKPGQYLGLWSLGQHQGQYEALVQRNPVTVWRDNNRDQVLDIGPDVETEAGVFGINCHRASESGTSHRVDKWSAGCQVLASATDFALLMALCRKALANYGNHFTYTLLEENQLWSP